jgi:hypothetical protein
VDLDRLRQSLDNTLSIDDKLRRNATADLEARALSPSTYAPLLLSLVRRPGGSSQQAQGAAICLKNLVKKHWHAVDAQSASPAAASEALADAAALGVAIPVVTTFGTVVRRPFERAISDIAVSNMVLVVIGLLLLLLLLLLPLHLLPCVCVWCVGLLFLSGRPL